MNNILVFLFIFKLGFLPDNAFVHDNNRITFNDSFHAEFGIELLILNHIFINAQMENYFKLKIGELSFSPYRDIYNISLGLRFDNFEIGVKHFCVHPVVGSVIIDELKGSVTEIYIQLTGKVNLF